MAVVMDPGGETRTAQFTLTFVIVADEDDGGFIAQCQQFPGLVTQGDTREELDANIRDLAHVALEEAALSHNLRPEIVVG